MCFKILDMHIHFLFPHAYKRLGWMVLIPSLLVGFVVLVLNYEPSAFDFQMPAIFIDEFFGKKALFGTVENNILNEIMGVLIIIGALLVGFSKEKMEDEFIAKIRLESLVWSVYVNYGVLLFAFLFIYDLSFLWVMIFNMFTLLLFFIVRFHWQLQKLKKTFSHEE